MRRLFLLLAMTAIGIAINAQSTQIATLSHEGNIRTWYGVIALDSAYRAAVNGDVITLSSGLFKAVDIKKAITIRGAGHDINLEESRQPTVITGDFYICAPEEATDAHLILEGLFHNDDISYADSKAVEGAQFIKCRFNDFSWSSGGNLKNASFIHCRIVGGLDITDSSDATCINSYISNFRDYSSSIYNTQFLNCIINHEDNSLTHISKSIFHNCIFLTKNTSCGIKDTCAAYNCIAVGTPGVFFKYITNLGNKTIEGYDIFKSYAGEEINDDTNFSLTEEAQTTYLGNDGTQVGIYGGLMPYETTPNNPQITKFNVAKKTSADGKLSVDINVAIPE